MKNKGGGGLYDTFGPFMHAQNFITAAEATFFDRFRRFLACWLIFSRSRRIFGQI